MWTKDKGQKMECLSVQKGEVKLLIRQKQWNWLFSGNKNVYQLVKKGYHIQNRETNETLSL